MCRLWSFPSYWLLSWAAGWATGWATGWQQGIARHASSLSRAPMPRIRTPLLRLHVATLRLNPTAGQRRPYEMRGGHLRLVKSA